MEPPAKLLGHSLHHHLVAFPLGLIVTAVVSDLIAVQRDWPDLARAAAYMLAAGVILGGVAALTGLLDWAAIPSGTRARRVSTLHGGGMLLTIGLSAGAWLPRRDDPANPSTVALAIEIAALLVVLISAWLGNELVVRLGVGVDRGAHLDAPSSLSGRPTSESETLPALRRRSVR